MSVTGEDVSPRFDFSALLALHGIDPEDVALAFHKPSDGWKRRALCMMAQEDPEAFNAYQSTHPKGPEATVKKRMFLASFVPTSEGEMTFVGMFKNFGAHQLGGIGVTEDPPFLRVISLIYGSTFECAKHHAMNYVDRYRFDLRECEALRDLKGRLVVSDPGARAYMRLAEKLSVDVLEIKRSPSIAPPMPKWDELVIVSDEMKSLPRDWALRLSEWRGVYLIVDQSDGARYVGSAYGENNLLGRWSTHVSGEFGVTEELSKRRVQNLRFSILELLSPNADAKEVIAKERLWMLRLGTIENGLNS